MGLKFFFLAAALAQSISAASVRDRTFDYIVLGGGTAGLVVAARLSEVPGTTVAVIEAGIHHVNQPLVDTPEMFGQAMGNPNFDWGFVTVPQPGLDNKVIGQARGKMLGGSSGLNFMAWDRASSEEYDAWEKLGAKGWNWKNLLPYFKKTEAVLPQLQQDLFPGASQIPDATFNQWHGRSGPLQVSYNTFYSNVTAPYVETLNALGIPTNSDPYEGDGTGIYNGVVSIDGVRNVGKRSYSATAYYQDNASKPNLVAFTSTQATRVNFATDNSPQLRAVSVNVVSVGSGGVTGTITARKEVILSAGAYQTPQLLELSGIGNKDILKSVGIKALVDLPGVGENLQDHTLLAQDFQLNPTAFTYDQLRNNATFASEQQAQYAANGTGLFSSAQLTVCFPALKSVVSPEFITTLKSGGAKLTNASGISPLTKAQYKIQSSWLTNDKVSYTEIIMYGGGGFTAISPVPDVSYLSLFMGIMHPFARGTVHINSSQALAPPVIDPRYLDNDVDMQLALQATKFVRTIAQTQPLASWVSSAHSPIANMTTDAEWLQYIQSFTGSIFHPIGTAAMLPRNIGGVVDPETLKVYGTSNLRVVDASLFPMLIATHPQATVYAIAERASDIIKGRI